MSSDKPTMTAPSAATAATKTSSTGSGTKIGLGIMMALAVLTMLADNSIIQRIPESLMTTTSSSSSSSNSAASREAIEAANQQKHINRTAYQWFGKHWIPPEGIPTYSLQQIQQTFSKHHTLIIGDSTARRLYGTLFHLLDAPHTAGDIHHYELDAAHRININKHRGPYELCKYRDFVFPDEDPNATSILHQFWKHPEEERAFHCRHIRASPAEEDSAMMRYDFGESNCLNDLPRLVNVDFGNDRAISNNYTLIIIGVGIWEAVRTGDCMRNRKDGNVTKRLQNAMDWVQALPDRNRTVVWRSSGYDERDVYKDLTYDLNADARRMVETLKQNRTLNMTFLDWGTAIYPRSFEGSRITGDLKPHYGLEARLLCIQMLVHELRQREAGILT